MQLARRAIRWCNELKTRQIGFHFPIRPRTVEIHWRVGFVRQICSYVLSLNRFGRNSLYPRLTTTTRNRALAPKLLKRTTSAFILGLSLERKTTGAVGGDGRNRFRFHGQPCPRLCHHVSNGGLGERPVLLLVNAPSRSVEVCISSFNQRKKKNTLPKGILNSE